MPFLQTKTKITIVVNFQP